MRQRVWSFSFSLGLVLFIAAACRIGASPASPTLPPAVTNQPPASTMPAQQPPPAVTAAAATAIPSPAPGASPQADGKAGSKASVLLRPEDFVYQGAFRLPQGGERPKTFEYGGNAMTFRPGGDAAGAKDGYPGSLFITGHDRLPYGELADGDQVAEVNIPAPSKAREVSQLPQAQFLQNFTDVARGFFSGLDEIPRVGLLYLDWPGIGPRLHLAWGQHLQPDPPAASHAVLSPQLSAPDLKGPWWLGSLSLYSVNGYLLEIPKDWADRAVEGRYVGAGRFRDGGWSGMGPALVAYSPYQGTALAPAGTHLKETTLLLYQSSEASETFENALKGYQHPDEWEGGAWITTRSGKTALLFSGTKSMGVKYWYGYQHPGGVDRVCVDTDLLGQFTLCRLANGAACPQSDLGGCTGHGDYRGWWSTKFSAQMILYNPDDLERVAQGQMKPWQPQPYAVVELDPVFYLNPSGTEVEMLGKGVQRRYRTGDAAFDRENGLLYVLELFADEARPVVHVWKVQ